MSEPDHGPHRASRGAQGKRRSAPRWKRLLIHLRHEQRPAAAPQHVDGVGDKTEERGKLVVVRTLPLSNRIVRARDGRRQVARAEPVMGGAQHARLARVAHPHVPGRDDVDRQAVDAGVEPQRGLRPGTAHHADEPVRDLVPRFQNGKVRRAGVEEHHDRGLALRLPLAEQELIAPRPEPLDVSHGQVRDLDRVAAHLAERDAEVGLFPGPADRVPRHPAAESMLGLVVRRVDEPIPGRGESEVLGHRAHVAVRVELVVDVRTLEGHDRAASLLGEKNARAARARRGR